MIDYIWFRLPLILLFINGYIVYRMLVVNHVTDTLVFWCIQKNQGGLRRLCLYIIMSSALLSLFIPNAVTVLIMLPVLQSIANTVHSMSHKKKIVTALTLSTIYGANIGGMGSLIGSPANLLLLGALDLLQVPGKEKITFFNWFVWAIPLVLIFVCTAWIIIIAYITMSHSNKIQIELPQTNHHVSKKQSMSLILFFIFIGFWSIESIIKEMDLLIMYWDQIGCIIYLLVFMYLLFKSTFQSFSGPLLPFREIFSEFPKRGMFFVGILLIIIAGVSLLHIHEYLKPLFYSLSHMIHSPFYYLWTIAFLVIILTEMLSNTVVSTVFFSVAYYSASIYSIHPMFVMIAVSTASTCAFMTPIATPCNALAFGEMKHVSFPAMLFYGLVLNIMGSLLIGWWVYTIVPFVYRI